MEHTHDVVSASGPAEVDVHLEQEPAPTIAYRAHLTVYEESLIMGSGQSLP